MAEEAEQTAAMVRVREGNGNGMDIRFASRVSRHHTRAPHGQVASSCESETDSRSSSQGGRASRWAFDVKKEEETYRAYRVKGAIQPYMDQIQGNVTVVDSKDLYANDIDFNGSDDDDGTDNDEDAIDVKGDESRLRVERSDDIKVTNETISVLSKMLSHFRMTYLASTFTIAKPLMRQLKYLRVVARMAKASMVTFGEVNDASIAYVLMLCFDVYAKCIDF
ncbi:hypothetical protein GUJ93_ZPchr0002g26235 [Zizania palustris]|uniref:Uncharacterized protein n=1 Tax=Zizania palustris TaxID=103762 RepID=A0A8J5VCG2_ZIZPA|nr:hypothetical protein GUJ93_ZPchr0002g26235 [Zizania palustris]